MHYLQAKDNCYSLTVSVRCDYHKRMDAGSKIITLFASKNKDIMREF